MSEQASDLEISEDLAFQRRTWLFERIGWGVLASIIGAALLGFFGRGLMGPEVAATEDGRLTVEYYRFWRLQSPTTLSLRLGSAGTGREARVWVDNAYLESMRISQITPQPERVEAGSDRLIHVFALAEDGVTPIVIFEIEADRPWRQSGRIGVVGGGEVTIRQFIYP